MCIVIVVIDLYLGHWFNYLLLTFCDLCYGVEDDLPSWPGEM